MERVMEQEKKDFPTAAEPVRDAHGHRPPSSGRVLLTDLTEARRAAAAGLLQEQGYEVYGCRDAEAVMRRAKTCTPDVVILDVELPHGQPEQCVRALARCYQTASISFVLACPRSFDRRRLIEMVHEGATIILPKPYTRQQLLDTVKTAVQRSQTVRADLAILLGAQATVTSRVESNNSLLYRPIHCLLHTGRPQFDRYLLRPGAATVENDLFGVPSYNATGGHEPVDFNVLSVLVCPECLFASAHVGYFLDPAERKEKRHHFDAATLRVLENDLAERQRVFAGRSGDFFNEKRTEEDAKIAYELAARCSAVLHGQNPHTLPMELLRLANYRLMLARFWESTDEAMARKQRTAAVDPLKRSIAAVDGVGRAKAAHQLVSLGVSLGELEMAKTYMTLLADMEAAAPTAMKEQIQPYLMQAKGAVETMNGSRG
jgi:FixJ family two-component response regulator